MNGTVSTSLKVAGIAITIVLAAVTLIAFIGGELRALDDHIASEKIHPEASSVQHMADDIAEMNQELKEFRKETREDFKDLRNQLNFEHPNIGPTE